MREIALFSHTDETDVFIHAAGSRVRSYRHQKKRMLYVGKRRERDGCLGERKTLFLLFRDDFPEISSPLHHPSSHFILRVSECV